MIIDFKEEQVKIDPKDQVDEAPADELIARIDRSFDEFIEYMKTRDNLLFGPITTGPIITS